jgi:hypothetical protein
MTTISYDRPIDRAVHIPVDGASIEADWTMPLDARGIVILAQGNASGRFSRRKRSIAHHLYDRKFATLLLDLLTPEEELEDALTASLRFDVKFLAARLISATEWLKCQTESYGMPVGYCVTATASGAAGASADQVSLLKDGDGSISSVDHRVTFVFDNDDLDFSDDPGALERVARACRSSASFPGAFEPSTVEAKLFEGHRVWGLFDDDSVANAEAVKKAGIWRSSAHTPAKPSAQG